MSAATSACSQAEFAAALLDPDQRCPAGLRAWNGSDPSQRLAVYRNNVLSSLVDALADTFEVTQQLVGDEFFRAMAAVFARRSPPTSRILAFYGEDFPNFIEQFEPARPLPYLADVARLEMLRVRAYHAADAPAVDAEVVTAALGAGEQIGALRLRCHPSLAALASRHAVVSLWAAHQDLADIEQIDVEQPECGIVVRQGLDVLVLHAPAGAGDFVAALQQGHKLADAAAAAVSAEPAFDLTATLGLLLGHGALTAIHLEGVST